jgi:osmotically-inducible protein OsmY
MLMKRLALVALPVFFWLGACSNTVEGLKQDAKENKVEERAERAAEAVSSAVKEAGHEVKAQALALEVRAALMADKAVDSGDVHVASDDDAKTLTLTGSVPTAAQKDAAGAIARGRARDYRVLNQLKVGRS